MYIRVFRMIMDIFVVLVLFALVGAGSVALSNYFSRHLRRIEKAAEELVRLRIQRKAQEGANLLSENLVDHSEVTVFFKILNKKLGLKPTRIIWISRGDRFSDVFRVERSSLSVSDSVWKNARLGKYIEVFWREFDETLRDVLGEGALQQFILRLN